MYLMVNNEKLPVTALVEDLKSRRADLDRLIQAFEHAILVGPSLLSSITNKEEHPQGSQHEGSHGIAAPNAPAPSMEMGPYNGLSASKASIHCLKEAGKPLSTRELAGRLVRGGFRTQAKNFTANLETALKVRPLVFKKLTGGLWSLVEWHVAA